MTKVQDGSLAEFTLKAVVTGILLGIVFGAANAYLGLRVGMTVSASIPAAVMTVAVFGVLRKKGTILEANLSQTIGSASTALATGAIFTIPALFLWGMVPPFVQVAVLCLLGGILGVSAMIPLRRLLIVREKDTLPYPEGMACAEVLRATAEGTSGSAWIFRGMAVGAAVKLAVSLLFLVPSEIGAKIPFLPKAEAAIEIAPALIAVGFILGYQQSAVVVAGSIVSAFALTPLIAWIGASLSAPLYPETVKLVSQMDAGDIWSRYVRYIGAGAVATGGIVTVLHNLPSMVSAFRAVAKGMARKEEGPRLEVERTDRDLHGGFVIGGILLVVLVAGLVPGVFAGNMPLVPRLVCAAGVGVFGVLFVAVAARIVGIVGVSSQPTSGIALVTILGIASIFAAAGWIQPGARAAVLTVGTIVAIAASKAGDISQDLKTGYLVGATPARQQLGQLIGGIGGVLGRRGDDPPPRLRLRLRVEGAPRPPGDADEDDHRGGPGGKAAVGPRPLRRRDLPGRQPLRRLGARVLHRGLPAAGVDGSRLPRGVPPRPGGPADRRRPDRREQPRHPRRVGDRRGGGAGRGARGGPRGAEMGAQGDGAEARRGPGAAGGGRTPAPRFRLPGPGRAARQDLARHQFSLTPGKGAPRFSKARFNI